MYVQSDGHVGGDWGELGRTGAGVNWDAVE